MTTKKDWKYSKSWRINTAQMTQRELAGFLNQSVKTVQSWDQARNGGREPGLKNKAKMECLNK